jgi:hypothetical protein
MFEPTNFLELRFRFGSVKASPLALGQRRWIKQSWPDNARKLLGRDKTLNSRETK